MTHLHSQLARRRRTALTRPWSAALAPLGLALLSCGNTIAAAPVVALRADLSAGRAATADAMGLHFEREGGDRIALRMAKVTVSSVELFACPSVAGRILELLSPIGVARAHGVSTDLKMAAPQVLDLLRSGGQSVGLGRLLPPAGRYCFAHIVFGQADADAASASGAPEMTGRTLALEGEIQRVGASTAEPFTLSSSGVAGVDEDLGTLTVAAGDSVALTFGIPWGSWLDGLDLGVVGAGDRVLSRIAQTTTAAASR